MVLREHTKFNTLPIFSAMCVYGMQCAVCIDHGEGMRGGGQWSLIGPKWLPIAHLFSSHLNAYECIYWGAVASKDHIPDVTEHGVHYQCPGCVNSCNQITHSKRCRAKTAITCPLNDTACRKSIK